MIVQKVMLALLYGVKTRFFQSNHATSLKDVPMRISTKSGGIAISLLVFGFDYICVKL